MIANAETKQTSSPSEPTELATATLHALLVDDSSAIRELMQQKLREVTDPTWSLDIHSASCGEEAVSLAESRRFDVIFMDVQMPGIGGLQACRLIKQIHPNTRIVMLTSMSGGDDHRIGHEAGCDNYLTKPPNDADVKVIMRLVSLRKLTEA